MGLATLSGMEFPTQDIPPVARLLQARLAKDPEDAAALLDLGIVLEILGLRAEGLRAQAQALVLRQVYRMGPEKAGLRLLMFATEGDLAANVPLSFLLQDSDVDLVVLYVLPGRRLPEVPPHDLALVGVGVSEETEPVLARIAELLPTWPRPVLLDPGRIRRLSRERIPRLLEGVEGLRVPGAVPMDREALARLAAGDLQPEAFLSGCRYPLLLRPLDAHGGHGLARIEGPREVATYLNDREEGSFYLSPFMDYRGVDGFYRKRRIAFVDGQPFLGHMAVSEHWMVHYLNAGMEQSEAKRAEEARAFETFETDFLRRHGPALRALSERIGLEYFSIDCGETPAGELLLFEADTAGVVHAMDSPELFPYKRPRMELIFQAFRAMLARRAGLISAPSSVPGPLKP
jgi:hypothetical protein